MPQCHTFVSSQYKSKADLFVPQRTSVSLAPVLPPFQQKQWLPRIQTDLRLNNARKQSENRHQAIASITFPEKCKLDLRAVDQRHARNSSTPPTGRAVLNKVLAFLFECIAFQNTVYSASKMSRSKLDVGELG